MKNSLARIAAVLVASLTFGCGGGGPSGNSAPPPPPPSPSIEVLPATFDFGTVTSGNSSAPLEVTIRNTGGGSLQVSSIGFTAGSNPAFSLNLSGGARPCGAVPRAIAAGESCTARVSFQPSGSGDFRSDLQVASNDGRSPVVGVPITGRSEPLSALTVRISQVDNACSPTAATAYVSVVDQGGFPLLGLNTGNFQLSAGGSTQNLLLGATLADSASKPIAIVAALDNSGSITNQPVMYADMKNAFAGLFNAMRSNDVGQLLNFGSEYQITVPFPTPSSVTNPTNRAALVAGLADPWTGGRSTLLYDSVYKAIDDAALQGAYRRVVIVATDGFDDLNDTGSPASTRTVSEVIANAASKGIPVFTIGIGDSANTDVLRDMAAGTGGVFYNAHTSQNLATIFQQLSSLLFANQYALTFTGSPGIVGSPVSVFVTSPNGVPGSATKTVTSCN